jgi:hypothetical protein
MGPQCPKGQASLYDLGCTKRKRTEDDGPARDLIIRLRPDVQQAVAARDAAIAASIASRPASAAARYLQQHFSRGGRTHSARARARGRGRGLETLEISETTTEEDEGEEEGGEAMQE